MDRPTAKLPGNRVVRRRLDATQVIDLPTGASRMDVPHVRTHAKRFVVAFTVVVLVGALLLALPWTTESGRATPPIDAFVTAVSASAVTGLVVVDTQDHWNFLGELVILVLMQLGGLGFMVGASIVLSSLGRGLSLRDSLMLQDGSPTLSLQEATSLSKRILRFIIIIETAGAIALIPRFMRDESFFNAVWHGIFTSVAAFCNSGFDLQGNYQSMAAYADSIWVNVVLIILIQAGALSYIVLTDIWNTRRWQPLTLEAKLVLIANAVLLLGGMAAFMALEWSNSLATIDAWARPMAALFQSTSMRTAGFATVNFGELHPATLFLTIGIMMGGGAAGSTAGGIKLATLALLVLTVVSTVRGQPEAQAFGRRISSALVFRAMAVAAMFVFAHFLLSLALAISEDVIAGQGFGFLPLMFETMSAMATAGFSTGVTPALSSAGKVIVCLAMYIGWLGPLTAVYALQRRQRPTRYRFPEAPVRIG